MRRKREKKIAYKETEVFELFPNFEYTKLQKARCTLFHGYAKSFRKIINYAINFDVPNKICLVWIVGQPKEESIIHHLEKSGCSSNVWVLTSPFPDEGLETWKQYDELRKTYGTVGYWDKELDVPSKQWYDEVEKNKKIGLKVRPDMYTELVEKDNIHLEIIHQYKRLKKASKNTHFKKFRLYRNGYLPKPFTFADLDKYIIKTFPEGVEAKGINTYSAVSPAGIDKGIRYGIDNIPIKQLGFTLEENNSGVKAVKKAINTVLEKTGYISLSELRNILYSPPFGFRLCAYSAACVSRALKEYDNRTLYYFDSLISHFAKDHVPVLTRMILDNPIDAISIRRDEKSYIYIESHPHKVVKQFMSKLFNRKIITPGDEFGRKIVTNIVKQYRLPFECIDERLIHLTLWDVEWWNLNKVKELANEIEQNKESLLSSWDKYKQADAKIDPEVRKWLAEYSFMWKPDSYRNMIGYTNYWKDYKNGKVSVVWEQIGQEYLRAVPKTPW